MICFRFHVGLVTKSGARVDSIISRACEELVAHEFGACTVLRGTGLYHDLNRTFTEPTMVIETWQDTTKAAETGLQERARNVAELLKDQADQDEVGLATVYGTWSVV